MYCAVCGYNVSHSHSHVCSECGTPFDPEKSSTYCTSPKLVHRVMQCSPVLRTWIIEHHCDVRCRNCGVRIEEEYEPGRCARCNVYYDPRDPHTVTRALHILPPGAVRFQHVAPVRGVILPMLLMIYGLWCIIAQDAWLPAWGARQKTTVEFAILHNLPAVMMGVAWLGAALALHSRYFWERVEPCWKWAPIGMWIGIGIIVIGWGYAFGWAVHHYVLA